MPDVEAYEIRAPKPREVRLRRLGKRRHMLSLAGYLPGGWQGRLATGMAHSGLSIVSGFTASDGFGLWRGEIEFDWDDGQAKNPKGMDFESLLEAPASEPLPVAPTFDSVELTRVSQYACSLRLSVRGADSIGCLAALLGGCASHDLYPLELRIRTREGKIDDLAFLKPSSFGPPARQQENALRSWLCGSARLI